MSPYESSRHAKHTITIGSAKRPRPTPSLSLLYFGEESLFRFFIKAWDAFFQLLRAALALASDFALPPFLLNSLCVMHVPFYTKRLVSSMKISAKDAHALCYACGEFYVSLEVGNSRITVVLPQRMEIFGAAILAGKSEELGDCIER